MSSRLLSRYEISWRVLRGQHGSGTTILEVLDSSRPLGWSEAKRKRSESESRQAGGNRSSGNGSGPVTYDTARGESGAQTSAFPPALSVLKGGAR